jgi:hypothetical protein
MGFFRKTSSSAQDPPLGSSTVSVSSSYSPPSVAPAGAPVGSTTPSNNYGATAPPSSFDETLLQQQQQQRPGLESQPSYFQNLNPANPTPMPPLNPREERAHRALQRIQYLMDNAVKIPGLNRRVGLDPVIGLIPGIGDFGSALVSLVMVARAAPHLSRYTVIRVSAEG